MTSDSETESHGQSSRKRQRSSATARAGRDGDDSKKARGRPRVEAQDETAADRRRTQIRLAQRAYRQRKETTISSLKKQVSELHKTIDEMSNGFLEFHARATQSGIANERPSFGRELNVLLERFTILAKNANKVAEGSEGEEHGEEEPASASPTRTAKASGLSSNSTAPIINAETRQGAPFTDVTIGYQTRVPRENNVSSSDRTSEERSSGDDLSAELTQGSTLLLQRFSDPLSSNFLPWMSEIAPTNGSTGLLPQYDALFPTQPTFADSLDQAAPFDSSAPLTLLDGPFSNYVAETEPEPIGSMMVPGPTMIAGISARMGLPYTFSFQETTFSRRLNRAAIERAFHLVSQSDVRSQRFNRVFRLTLMYWTRDEVRARLKSSLGRTANESLDNFGGPFQHLGGSGTHYPRKDGKGNIIPRPETFNERRIGPIRTVIEREAQAMGTTSAMALARSGTDNWAVLDGYEGEWFDADDVSGYLEELGVTIPAQASFVEGEIEEEQDPDVAIVPSGGTEVPDPIDFAELFAPSSTTLSGMPLGNNDGKSVETDSIALESIFHHHNFAAPRDQAPATTTNRANDYFDFGAGDDFLSSALEKPNAFTSSAWFDEPQQPVSTEQSSPGLTSGTTASSVEGAPAPKELMEWMTDKPLKRKRNVTIEVSKLIDELIRRGVCIGRSPGFRRRDVDEALRASVISVF